MVKAKSQMMIVMMIMRMISASQMSVFQLLSESFWMIMYIVLILYIKVLIDVILVMCRRRGRTIRMSANCRMR
jgi:hypothetical protein